eukprot:16994-Heterococcus_DN1.PRE.1
MIFNFTADCMHQVYTYKRRVQCLDLPLAVLTDGGSASASEIIVGCLKDSNRAAVLGERTYGKGLAQGMFELKDGSGVLVSIFKLRTPAGVGIHGYGIEPHRYAVGSSINVDAVDPTELCSAVLPATATQTITAAPAAAAAVLAAVPVTNSLQQLSALVGADRSRLLQR